MLFFCTSEPTVYLTIEIDGREVNPGSQTTTYILTGMRPSPEVINCRTRGPAELTAPVDPTLSWTFDLADTSLAPFNSISGVVPPLTYNVSTLSGNITVNVTAGMTASVVFTPRLTPELQGRYRCTGSSTTGALQQEVNVVVGECKLPSAITLGCDGYTLIPYEGSNYYLSLLNTLVM